VWYYRSVLLVFVLHFPNGNCYCVADGEMFLIRMRKLHNISIRQTYRWTARFVGFSQYIQFQDQTSGLWENSKNVPIVLHNLRPTQQNCRCNMHIHEWTPRRTDGHSPHGSACWLQPAATRPFPQIILGRLVMVTVRVSINIKLLV